MSSFHLKSHPKKYLIDHLQEVSSLGLSIKDDLISYPLLRNYLDKGIIDEIIRIICITHDLGKGTLFFQNYLMGKLPVDNFLKSHSTISSLYAYYSTEKLLIDNLLPFITLMIVQGHHGMIPSPSSAIIRIYKHREQLMKQFENYKHKDELDSVLAKNSLPKFLECRSLIETIKIFNEIRKRFVKELEHINGLYPYYLTNILFSILIDADRIKAANINSQLKISNNININKIQQYIDMKERDNAEKFGKAAEILKLRSVVKNTVLQKVDYNIDTNLFSLTAPTGSGKTLTAFLFASLIKQRIISKYNRIPRIIYVLPFLSIIDQNKEVLREAIGLSSNDIQNNIMITHHHLVKFEYGDISNESFSNSQAQLLIEGWNAELIVTTFVQFLKTIIGTNTSLF